MSDGTTFNRAFLKQIAAILLTAAIAGAYPLIAYATEEVIDGVLAGVALSVVHVAMGYSIIRFSWNKPYDVFMQIVLGGIAFRLLVMVGLLLVCLAVFRIHAVALIGSLFVMYIVFLALEVFHIHSSLQHSSSR